MLINLPLFDGSNSMGQLIKIIKILGSPTEDDIKGMNLQKLDMDWMYIMPMKMMKILLN